MGMREERILVRPTQWTDTEREEIRRAREASGSGRQRARLGGKGKQSNLAARRGRAAGRKVCWIEESGNGLVFLPAWPRIARGPAEGGLSAFSSHRCCVILPVVS